VPHSLGEYPDLKVAELEDECCHQLSEIAQRKNLFRAARPKAPVSGRSVIIADDGIATGSTMSAALQMLKLQQPHELIVAVPVAPFEPLEEIRSLCDEVICLHTPEEFWTIGDFYADFARVDDNQAADLLRAVLSRRA
jgi:putative phosphoribosyl transferase